MSSYLGIRKTLVLGVATVMALVVSSGEAAANAPLRVCGTCAFTDVSSALAAASAQDGGDMIRVDAGSYRNPIVIDTDVTVFGAGVGTTTLGYIDVEDGVTAVVRDVTVTGLSESQGGESREGIRNLGTLTLKRTWVTGHLLFLDHGAGIHNEGNLTLQDTTVSDNAVPSSSGGGIYNEGELVLRNSHVSENSARFLGGGIYNRGTALILNSTVADNLAFSPTLGGGGIFNDTDGVVVVRGSDVSRNTDTVGGVAAGGGVYNRGTLSIQDSAVTDNRSWLHGGGIYNDTTGVATLRDSTISGNAVVALVGLSVGTPAGGGIYNRGVVELRNSIVNDNTAPTSPGIANDGGTVVVKDSEVQP